MILQLAWCCSRTASKGNQGIMHETIITSLRPSRGVLLFFGIQIILLDCAVVALPTVQPLSSIGRSVGRSSPYSIVVSLYRYNEKTRCMLCGVVVVGKTVQFRSSHILPSMYACMYVSARHAYGTERDEAKRTYAVLFR